MSEPTKPPFLAKRVNGNTIICEATTLRHVCTMEAWPEKEMTAELIVDAVNNYERLKKTLLDLLFCLEYSEDIEHDFFGCRENEEICPLCAAKKLRDELNEPRGTVWVAGMYPYPAPEPEVEPEEEQEVEVKPNYAAWLTERNLHLRMHAPGRRFFEISFYTAKDGPMWTARQYDDPSFTFSSIKWCAALTPEELFEILEVELDDNLQIFVKHLRPTGTSPYTRATDIAHANEWGKFEKKARTKEPKEVEP